MKQKVLKVHPKDNVLVALTDLQKGETIEEDSDRDRWFTAEDAKKYGFVDHVVKSAGQVSGSGGTSR